MVTKIKEIYYIIIVSCKYSKPEILINPPTYIKIWNIVHKVTLSSDFEI